MFGDEKAYALIETDMTPWRASLGGKRFKPDSWQGLRRYQLIGVNRSDRIALWIQDMGPANTFRFGALQVLSLWEHTVAEVQDIATDMRERDVDKARNFMKAWQQQLAERWPEMAYQQTELLKLNRASRSAFGSLIRVERNAFVREEK